MRSHHIPRRHAEAGGFTLLEFVVVLTVVAALWAVLLNRLADVQHDAREAAARHVLSAVETAFRVRLAQAPSKERALTALAAENPVSWLATLPSNYRGEIDDVAISGVEDDSWVFDRRDKTLLYVPQGYKSLSFNAASLLKFKVEFPRNKISGQHVITLAAVQPKRTVQAQAGH